MQERSKYKPTAKNILSDHEKERFAQESFGRKQLTLKVDEKESKTKNKIVPQKTGHDAYLAKIVSERKRIKIETWSGKVIVGELLEFDKYSIKIRKDGISTWYNKSSIESFGDAE